MISLPLPACTVGIKSVIVCGVFPRIRDVGHEPRNELVRCDLFRVLGMIIRIGVGVGDLLLLAVIDKTRQRKRRPGTVTGGRFQLLFVIPMNHRSQVNVEARVRPGSTESIGTSNSRSRPCVVLFMG